MCGVITWKVCYNWTTPFSCLSFTVIWEKSLPQCIKLSAVSVTHVKITHLSQVVLQRQTVKSSEMSRLLSLLIVYTAWSDEEERDLKHLVWSNLRPYILHSVQWSSAVQCDVLLCSAVQCQCSIVQCRLIKNSTLGCGVAQCSAVQLHYSVSRVTPAWCSAP